jgi:hypothetical protein
MKKSAIRSRSSKGSHVIELASVSLILAVVTIMALDIGVIVFGTVVPPRKRMAMNAQPNLRVAF